MKNSLRLSPFLISPSFFQYASCFLCVGLMEWTGRSRLNTRWIRCARTVKLHRLSYLTLACCSQTTLSSSVYQHSAGRLLITRSQIRVQIQCRKYTPTWRQKVCRCSDIRCIHPPCSAETARVTLCMTSVRSSSKFCFPRAQLLGNETHTFSFAQHYVCDLRLSNVADLSTAPARAQSLSMYAFVAFVDEFDSRHNICFYLNLYVFLFLSSLVLLLLTCFAAFCQHQIKYVYTVMMMSVTRAGWEPVHILSRNIQVRASLRLTDYLELLLKRVKVMRLESNDRAVFRQNIL